MVIDEVTAGGLAKMCEQAVGNEDIAWFDALSRAIHEVDPCNNVNGSCRDYSRSINDAASLLPLGYRWTMDSWSTGWAAGVWEVARHRLLITADRRRQAATPALALCNAGLLLLVQLGGAK